MKRRLTTKLLLASIALAPIAAAPTSTATAQSVVSPSQEIVLSIGRGELVNVPGTMADVFISNDSVADVQIKSQRQLYLFGKSGGETTLYASNAAGDIIWAATVRVGSNIGSIDQMLALAMPQAKINVATMGTNTVLLTGTVAAPEDAADAQSLVEAYVGEGTNVISRLRMATPLQVNLQVRIAEVSRSVVKAIGMNLATVDATSGFRFGVSRGFNEGIPGFTPGGPAGFGVGFTEPTDGGTDIPNIGGTTLGLTGNLLGLDVLSALDLAETQGLVTTLSQPNLTALSGETAEFLAGGEFPIPLSGGLGTTTIEYKKFGVSLAYSPTVLANGRISMRVRPEVSEISSQNSIQINGFQVPSLVTRRAETTVELGSGQSFMIAGLLQNSAQNSIDKAPGLGDIPVLGNLFRSTNYRKGETELVIVVTPYLVKPVNANDIRLPTDGYLKPTEAQRLLELREADGRSGASRPMPRAAGEGAAPEISHGPAQPGDEQLASADEARRNEKTAAAMPGFSFE
ncbi:type II and III secretion system protein family protein [Qipengyuania vesicularis]|uniref:type II and III secretion system protein family protein n=1 Tax=Qipengyuania vesicularis TaxID=2867232 RepID=UPI001C88D22E|nr:type II and III secretion system protein family protein [Qipengyuania vesicularis]MBX7527495.1 type II and III secretion system protein family protein [Qipengyuania vesicularis]